MREGRFPLSASRFAEARPAVNVLGLSIWQRFAEGDRNELRRIFEMCGIRVNAFVGSDCTLDELAAMPEAALNVVLYPEMAGETLELLGRWGWPVYVCEKPPVGFAATRRMVQDVCSQLDCSAQAYVEAEERARGRAWLKINGIYQMCGLPNGVRFAVQAPPSLAAGYTAFLQDYLGMIPVELESGEAELVFADANTIAQLLCGKHPFCGIEIAQPSMGYVELIPRTHLGLEGALFLVEQVLSGLMSRI